MAEKIVSPGVFTNENDQSFLATGVGNIGGAFIGPSKKGAAFIPTSISTNSEFVQKFGTNDGESYTSYAIKEYMNNAGQATFTRILGLGGYEHQNVAHLVMSGSYGQKIITTLHRSTTIEKLDATETLEESTLTFTSTGSFSLVVSGSNTSESSTYAGSLVSTDKNYIGKILPTEAKTSDVAYSYDMFSNSVEDLLTIDGSSTLSIAFSDLTLTKDYQHPETPWIKSQTVGGKSVNLFKVHSLSDGNSANNEIKIAISGIRYSDEVPGSDYGTFTLTVREIGDTDRAPKAIESFSNVNLDPNSSQYIVRVIGDKYPLYQDGTILSIGDYANKSSYIRIEVSDDVKYGSVSAELIPFGYAALAQPITPPANTTYPSASVVVSQEYNSQYNSRVYYGFDFNFTTTDNKQYLKVAEDNSGVGANTAFSLDNLTIHADAPEDAGVLIINSTVQSARKFIVPIVGGFDGMSPARPKNMDTDITSENSMGYDFTNVTSSGSVAYNRVFNILSNQDTYDFNLIVTPGLTYDLHPNVISNCIELCEQRADAFYIFDNTKLESSVATAAASILDVDSTYAATYYPWCKIFDADINRYLWVPPSVVVSGVIAYSDRVGFEWYAPAGLNRGILSAIDTYIPLTQANRDTLYENRINPIAKFPRDGIVVWGQKTTQAGQISSLSRVNVRRLLINVKKFIASSSRYLVFENINQRLYNRFLNIANPYLDQIQQNNGLYDFRLKMDDTNNTPESIDRNVLYGEIYLKPTKSAEYIILDFSVLPTGAVFPE